MSSKAFVEIEEATARRRLVIELSGGAGGAETEPPAGGAEASSALGSFLDAGLFQRIVGEAHRSYGFEHVTLTGSAPPLHPEPARIFAALAAEGMTASLLLDGEQFEAMRAALVPRPGVLTHVCLRLDGADAAAHDLRRGGGSFKRLVSALARCRAAGLPFSLLFAVRRETLPQLEQAALFAARLGAVGLTFRLGPARPEFAVDSRPGEARTESASADAEGPLDTAERAYVADEVATLARVFKMKVGLAEFCPCEKDAGEGHPPGETICRVDHRGHLTLCGSDSCGNYGAGGGPPAADLKTKEFAACYERLLRLAGAKRPDGILAGAGPASAGRRT
jgi:hypothetical protein